MKRVKTLTVLRKVEKLVANSKTWCQGAYARNRQDVPINFRSPEACKFCAEGAIFKTLTDIFGTYMVRGWPELDQALDDIAKRQTGQEYLLDVNDDLGQEAAVKVIRAAIAELGG